MSTLRDTLATGSHDRIEVLRSTMITVMRERGFLHDDRIEQAFRVVPRHRFAPEVSLEQAYDAVGIVRTKFDATGSTTSSVSAPYIQAMMLEQAGICPGHRVLEIGSGGFNAALAAELAGPDGTVTTVDLDPEVTARAPPPARRRGLCPGHCGLRRR